MAVTSRLVEHSGVMAAEDLSLKIVLLTVESELLFVVNIVCHPVWEWCVKCAYHVRYHNTVQDGEATHLRRPPQGPPVHSASTFQQQICEAEHARTGVPGPWVSTMVMMK